MEFQCGVQPTLLCLLFQSYCSWIAEVSQRPPSSSLLIYTEFERQCTWMGNTELWSFLPVSCFSKVRIDSQGNQPEGQSYPKLGEDWNWSPHQNNLTSKVWTLCPLPICASTLTDCHPGAMDFPMAMVDKTIAGPKYRKFEKKARKK